MNDTPDEPPISDVLGQRSRPRWLGAAIVLLIGLAIGSVIALRYRDDSGDAATTSSVGQASVVETSAVPETSEAAPTTDSTSPPTTDEPATTATDEEPTTDDSSTVDSTPPAYGTVEPGQGIATMKIPKINLTAFVLAGSAPAQMATALGHLSTTSAPGQIGNAVVVGYRTQTPALLKDLDQLAVGDVIEVDTVLGGVYFYQVDGTVVVEPTNASIVTASVPGKATLTVITCAPKGSTLQRLAVHAALVESLSSAADPAQVNYGQDGTPPAPSTEPCNMAPA
jgi:LPXTG-site transpeptidase (sortase) family protein